MCKGRNKKSKTESAAELFSEKVSGGGVPHKKVENNYLADLSAEARSAKADLSGVALANPEGRRKRWPVKEITRFWPIRIRL
jgi:hypothetical protein